MRALEFVSRLSLRAQLVLMLSAITLVLGIDRVRTIAIERAAETARAERIVFELARDGAEAQESVLSEARILFNIVSHMSVARQMDQSCRGPFASIVAEAPWLSSLILTDPAGDVVCSSGDVTFPGGLGDRDYFRAAMATEGFVVSGFIVSRFTGRPAIVVGMPIAGPDGIEALVFGRIDPDWLSRVAGRVAAGPGGQAYVIDRDRRIVAAAPHAGSHVGKLLSEALVAPGPLWHQTGVSVRPDATGDPQIVGVANLDATGGAFVVSVQRSAVLAEVNQRAKVAIAKLAGMALFCLLVVWLGGERLLLGPLSRLVTGVERIGRSEAAARVDARGMAPELERLARAFNSMAARLEANDSDLREANAKLQEMATRDGLTGLANRRLFDERLEVEWRRAMRDGSTVAAIVLDVDFFKQFNDTYGHPAGDACLRHVAEILARHANRPADLAARIGGEEFALLLPGASEAGALEIAERARRDIAAARIVHAPSQHGIVTASLGVAVERAPEGSAALSLLAAADEGLYRAKGSGRNRVARAETRLKLVS